MRNEIPTCGISVLLHFLHAAKIHISVLYSKSMYITLHLNFILVYLVKEIFDQVDYIQKSILNVAKMCLWLQKDMFYQILQIGQDILIGCLKACILRTEE